MFRIERGVYTTRSGLLVLVLGLVSNDHIGRTMVVKTKTGTEKVFVPIPYYRAQFKDTGEVVFYTQSGNIISENPGEGDKMLGIQRRVA